MGEAKFTGMVLPSNKLVSYYVEFKRLIMRRLVVGVADGIVKVDGKVIFEAKDLKVGLFSEDTQSAGNLAAATA